MTTTGMPGTPDTTATTPDAAARPAGAAHRREVPASVAHAYLAFMTAMVLTVVSGIVAVFFQPSVKDYADFIQGMHFPTDPAATRAAAEAGGESSVVNLVLIVVAVACFWFVARAMRNGVAWARTVMAVLAVLGLLQGVAVVVTSLVLTPIPLAGGVPGVALLLGLAASLAAFLVLVFRPASIRYFSPAHR